MDMTEEEHKKGLASVFIWAGVILCCTGIGALLGIPFLIVGIREYNS